MPLFFFLYVLGDASIVRHVFVVRHNPVLEINGKSLAGTAGSGHRDDEWDPDTFLNAVRIDINLHVAWFLYDLLRLAKLVDNILFGARSDFNDLDLFRFYSLHPSLGYDGAAAQ